MREIIDFTSSLQLATKALQFYTAEHPRSVEAIVNLKNAVMAMLADRDRVSLIAAQGALLVEGKPISNQTMHMKAFAKQLEDHHLGGFTITQGVGERELIEFIRLLAMKPAQIKDAGGADLILDRAGVIHIRVSYVRYEAITEGEEVVWSKSMRKLEEATGGASDLSSLLRRYLIRISRSAAAGGGTGAAAGESGAAAEGATGEGGGAGESSENLPVAQDEIAQMTDSIILGMKADEFMANSDAHARDLLHEAIAGMEPEVQFALLLSITRLPNGRLREILQPAARDLIAAGVGTRGGTAAEGGAAGAAGGGSGAVRSGADERDVLTRLLDSLPEQDRSIDLLRARIADLGITREQLDEVLSVIGWDTLSDEEKIEKLLAGDRIFDFPSEKLLVFIRRLLETKRYGDVLRLIEHYGRGLRHDSHYIRLMVCDTLGQVAKYMKEPGMNGDIEQLLAKLVLNQFVRESDPKVSSVATDAVAQLLISFIATGRAGIALGHLKRLGTATSASAASNPIRDDAWQGLLSGIATGDSARLIIEQLCLTDSDNLSAAFLPLVSFVGETISPALLESLGEEEDRNRRGRLVRALKTIGKPAYPTLQHALDGSIWYVTRNALNILGDIGSTELVPDIGRKLKHDDPRVRRAAARALGRIRGSEAEALLVGAISDPDREMQNEVLLCLGGMKALSAVPLLLDMAKPRRMGSGGDEVREVVISTLGQIGSPEAVPILSEIAKLKGAYGKQSPKLRVTAARALAAVGTTEAREALQKALASESDAATREQMAGALRDLRA